MKLAPIKPIGVFLLLAFLAGCSGGGDGYKPRAKTYKVTGKVTFLGSPLIGASVAFSPTGDQPVAVGMTDDNGEFTLMTYKAKDGAAAGDYQVAVMLVDSGDESASPEIAHAPNQESYVPVDTHKLANSGKKAGRALPAKYGDPKKSPLKATVEAGTTNEFEFDIK